MYMPGALIDNYYIAIGKLILKGRYKSKDYFKIIIRIPSVKSTAHRL